MQSCVALFHIYYITFCYFQSPPISNLSIMLSSLELKKDNLYEIITGIKKTKINALLSIFVYTDP